MKEKKDNSRQFESCFEYLGCRNINCIMFGNHSKYCWEVSDTLCNHPAVKIIKKRMPQECLKKVICKKTGCIYFNAALELGLVKCPKEGS